MNRFDIAEKVLFYLAPNLNKEFKNFYTWFIRLDKQIKVSEKLADHLFRRLDPKTATILNALILTRDKPDEALKLFDASFAILSILYLNCGESGTKSAKKAFALEKNELTFKVLTLALLKEGKTEEVKKIMKEFQTSDLKMKDFCCLQVKNDWKHLQDMHERDPRNGKIAEKLINHYISMKNPGYAIEVATRHVEYRGNSLEVRHLLNSLLK